MRGELKVKSIIKIFPVVVIGTLILNGIDILIAAATGMFVAIVVCIVVDGRKVNEAMNAAMDGARECTNVAFILMMAYAMAEIYMATGVGASAISIFLHMGVTGKTVALVTFLATCMLSVATGTSWGTYAACFPIFIWLSNMVGGDPVLTLGAAIGGSMFGDNIGLISDTTILSSGMQVVKVTDRVRVQVVWTMICVAIAAIITVFVASSMGLPDATGDPSQVLANMSEQTLAVLEEKRPSVLILLEQVQKGVPFYMVIPVFLVIALAIMRLDTIICLFAGIVLSVALGAISGTVSSITAMVDCVYTGFEAAGSWAMVMLLWAMGFGGIMRYMNAFAPISGFFVRVSKKVRHLVFCNGLLCLLMNGTLNEDLSQIATTGPIIKNIINDNVEGSEEDLYALRNRNALFADAIGVHTSVLIPWHVSVAYFLGIASAVFPLHTFQIRDLYYNFFSIISVTSLYVLTFTGWDRFIPMFGLPSEPQVSLKKYAEGKTMDTI